jgi:hypothetical protein
MANENETKIDDAVGPIGTESPAKSPVGVSTLFSRSPALIAAADEALVRQEAFRSLPQFEQVQAMASFLLYGRIGDD